MPLIHWSVNQFQTQKDSMGISVLIINDRDESMQNKTEIWRVIAKIGGD